MEALEACAHARSLEDSGDYEGARLALGELWGGIGEKPDLSGFSDEVKAEILIRIGALNGWLGSSRQVEGAQENAKDLIAEGIRILEALDLTAGIAEAQSELGICYWREGAYQEAEVFLNDALDKTPKNRPEICGKILLRLVNVAISTTRYQTAKELLKKASPLIEKYGDNLLLGKLYFHLGLVFNFLFEDDENPENSEKTIEYYQKAAHFYGLANHKLYQAVVENNLGFHFRYVQNLEQAHYHLDRAIKLFGLFENKGRLAPTYDAKARVFMEQSKLIEAELFAQKSVELLSEGDEYSLLAESLTTLGRILARQQLFEKAADCFHQAREKALYVNDVEAAGLALLSELEELRQMYSLDEQQKMFLEAQKNLSQTQRRKIKERLKKAEKICFQPSAKVEWENFSLTEEVRKFEAKFIKKALRETEGKVTKAAELLGLTHQNLSLMLKRRHKNLQSIKKPRRRRSDRKRQKKNESAGN
ncbi:MAG: helix-turn-helix domain-containing protein [Pyrinomonadaceae bacterium]